MIWDSLHYCDSFEKKFDYLEKEYGSFEEKFISFENIENFKEKIQVQCILINFRYLRPKNFNMKITLKFNQGLEANNLVSCNKFITIP